MIAVYPTRYHDALGDEQTRIENDGKQLRLVVRGVEFVGADFDGLESTLEPGDQRLSSFTFCQNELCACLLEWTMPLPVMMGEDVISGSLLAQLELGYPRPGGNQGIDREDLRLCLSYGGAFFWSKGTSGWFEDELLDIQAALPQEAYLLACISCAFSDYSPGGHGLFGGLACFRDNKASYLQVKGKRDLFAIWNTMTEFVQETYRCPEFQRRQPGVGYRG